MAKKKGKKPAGTAGGAADSGLGPSTSGALKTDGAGGAKAKKKAGSAIDDIFAIGKKAAAAESEAPAAAGAVGGGDGKGKKGVKGGDIDDIFHAGKAVGRKGGSELKDPELKDIAAQIAMARAAKKSSAPQDKGGTSDGREAQKVVGSKDDLFGEGGCARRKFTEEGYPIYGEEELGINKKDAGNTADCPFDCKCCY